MSEWSGCGGKVVSGWSVICCLRVVMIFVGLGFCCWGELGCWGWCVVWSVFGCGESVV